MKEKLIKIKNYNSLLIFAFILLSGAILPSETKAQKIDPKFQSVFIYGISRQVEWSGKNINFRIAVVGKNSTLIKELLKLAGAKKINNLSVQVEEIPSVTGSFTQEIVFVSSKNLLDGVLSRKGKNTLVMTAFSGGLEQGSHINFYLEGNKIAFDLNKTAINTTSLKINEALEKLASTIK